MKAKNPVLKAKRQLCKAGFIPDRDPLVQASNAAEWLSDFLSSAGDRPCPVRPVVAIPGWCVDRGLEHGTVCVIEPKDFPEYVSKQRTVLSPEEVRQLAYRLSRHIRVIPKSPPKIAILPLRRALSVCSYTSIPPVPPLLV